MRFEKAWGEIRPEDQLKFLAGQVWDANLRLEKLEKTDHRAIFLGTVFGTATSIVISVAAWIWGKKS